MAKLKLSPAVSDGLTALLNADPFHSAMLLDMELHEADNVHGNPMPTACTDGFRNIWINPDFAAKLTPEEVAFVIAHEVEHKILLFPIRFLELRRANKDGFSPQLFNIAQDFLINAQLDYAGYPVGPMAKRMGHYTVADVAKMLRLAGSGAAKPEEDGGGFMYDPSVRVDQTSESIYQQLFDLLPPPDKGGGGGGDGGGDGDGQGDAIGGIAGGDGNDVVMDAFEKACAAEGITPQQAGDQIANEIVSAAQAAAARDPGCLPGHVKALLEEYRRPSVNWQAQLRQFINGVARDDWSYRRPNRRSAGQAVIQPSMFSNRPGCIAVIVDTSASVSDRELEQVLSELVTISRRVKPQEIVVIGCDTQVRSVTTYRSGQPIRSLDCTGRGGTIMDPAFEWLRDNGKRPDCTIVCTDGEFREPPRELARGPIVWAICNPRYDSTADNFSYGRTIEVKLVD